MDGEEDTVATLEDGEAAVVVVESLDAGEDAVEDSGVTIVLTSQETTSHVLTIHVMSTEVFTRTATLVLDHRSEKDSETVPAVMILML